MYMFTGKRKMIGALHITVIALQVLANIVRKVPLDLKNYFQRHKARHLKGYYFSVKQVKANLGMPGRIQS